MTSEPFLKPRLTGTRFDGGVIPLEVLADFAVLEEMIVEVAKWRFREANPGRKRVPRGFTDGLTLKLTGIEAGSAIPIISLVVAVGTLFPPSSQLYFEEAKTAVLGAVSAAEKGTPITSFLPKPLLGYFDRFGRSLNEGESIQFEGGAGGSVATLTKEVRRKLVLASEVDEVTDVVILYGRIPEVDQQAKTFHIRLMDGTKVKSPLPPQHFETVMEAFNNYGKDQPVRMEASGRLNRANRLQGIESVEHISILDTLDIGARIEELRLLRAGWLDGRGIPLDPDGLHWLSESFDRAFPEDLPLPHLYPTAEGGVRAEWSLPPHELSLEIDLQKKSGNWHALNMEDDTEQAETIDLDAPSGWKRLDDEVRRLAGAHA